jgi:oxygen-independent coproporphyrinogen-3 oxidase
MNVWVDWQGFDEFQSSLTHLLRTFDSELECVFSLAPPATYDLRLTFTVDAERVQAELAAGNAVTDLRSDVGSDAGSDAVSVTQLLPIAPTRADVKRQLLRAALQLFEQWSGLKQPWGILTGVRPTKLLHQLLARQSLAQCRTRLRDEYLLAPEKVDLLSDIVLRQQQVIPDLYQLQREVSLYIGIPFCPTKCAYCTFPAYDIQQYGASVPGFLDGLLAEIRETGAWLRRKQLKVTTLYWGGGTPTSITAEQMAIIMDELERALPDYSAIREVTVEAGRPDTITAEKIDLLRARGVHRMSINPQSFTQETLDAIGRHHTVAETVEKFWLSRERGMDNINMDLIIGLPDEGVRTFEHTLAEVEKLLPESLTVHTLSFKRASKMTRERDRYEVAERDEIGEMMTLAQQFTTNHGYVPYYLYRQKNILGNLENTGYALPGRESLYNILMMEELQTIIGLGCGAVSKIVYHGSGSGQADDRIERVPNPKDPAQYNASWREYLQRKLALLDEAYGAPVNA